MSLAHGPFSLALPINLPVFINIPSKQICENANFLEEFLAEFDETGTERLYVDHNNKIYAVKQADIVWEANGFIKLESELFKSPNLDEIINSHMDLFLSLIKSEANKNLYQAGQSLQQAFDNYHILEALKIYMRSHYKNLKPHVTDQAAFRDKYLAALSELKQLQNQQMIERVDTERATMLVLMPGFPFPSAVNIMVSRTKFRNFNIAPALNGRQFSICAGFNGVPRSLTLHNNFLAEVVPNLTYKISVSGQELPGNLTLYPAIMPQSGFSTLTGTEINYGNCYGVKDKLMDLIEPDTVVNYPFANTYLVGYFTQASLASTASIYYHQFAVELMLQGGFEGLVMYKNNSNTFDYAKLGFQPYVKPNQSEPDTSLGGTCLPFIMTRNKASTAEFYTNESDGYKKYLQSIDEQPLLDPYQKLPLLDDVVPVTAKQFAPFYKNFMQRQIGISRPVNTTSTISSSDPNYYGVLKREKLLDQGRLDVADLKITDPEKYKNHKNKIITVSGIRRKY